MNEQIKETNWKQDFYTMLKKQQELDLYILENNPDVPQLNQWNRKLALYTEFGEFMNEVPSIFKYWKKTAKDNMSNALTEYVDMLHFLLSWINSEIENECQKQQIILDDKNFELILNHFKLNQYPRMYSDIKDDVLQGVIKHPFGNMICDVYETLINNFASKDVRNVCYHMFLIGILGGGFTWDEIYEEYMNKNKVNHQRQDNNY